MKAFPLRLLTIMALVLTPPAMATGLSPWQFGMSKSEVIGYSEYGPYKFFPNGDVETFNGIFAGQKEDVQFFFNGAILSRIGIYMYEGQNIKEAIKAWQTTYESLKNIYGEMEIPGIKIQATSGSISSDALAIAAGANTDVTGKTQMAPIKQPNDIFVFSSFFRQDISGVPFYYVVVYLNPRS